jgi:hypothetical protein
MTSSNNSCDLKKSASLSLQNLSRQLTIHGIAASIYKKAHTSILKSIAEFFNIRLNLLKGFKPIPFLITHQVLHIISL